MTTVPGTIDTHDEDTPLLGTEDAQTTSTSRSQKLTVMIAASTLILAMDFGFYLTAAPQIKIFESIVCHDYLAVIGKPPGTTLTEDICKSEPVQSELALVNGWKDTSDVLPGMMINRILICPYYCRLMAYVVGILFSVPYGVLADRWGRKPVLLLGILGTLLGESWVRVVCKEYSGPLSVYCISTDTDLCRLVSLCPATAACLAVGSVEAHRWRGHCCFIHCLGYGCGPISRG